jgi:hypothetical protein
MLIIYLPIFLSEIVVNELYFRTVVMEKVGFNVGPVREIEMANYETKKFNVNQSLAKFC